MAAEPTKFADLFRNPTIEAIYALSPREFESFIAYVLRRAGYDVKEVGPHFLRGLDLEMRMPGKRAIFGGVECKRFAPSQLVTAPIVRGVKGAPAVDRRQAKPFVFTTSDFNEAAHRMALAGSKRAYLLNGKQLIRYITYIQRSLHDDDDVLTSISPEYFADRSLIAQNRSNTKILTIANNKGGVGKTTTAYYLGVELARRGKRVLLIDLDGQANLTERCFPKLFSEEVEDGIERFPNITQYFSGMHMLPELITSTEVDGVSIIPSDPFLSLRDLGGSGRPGIELQFARDVQQLGSLPIATLGGTPDWIILDTPPAMSVFTRAGLAAAGYVLAPIRPRRVSLAGTRNMLKILKTMDALTGITTPLMGVLMTHWDDLKVSRGFEEIHLRRELQGLSTRVFDSKIPFDNRLETQEPGAHYRGAKAYETLVEEVLHYAE